MLCRGGHDRSASAFYQGWTAPTDRDKRRFTGNTFIGSASGLYQRWIPLLAGQYVHFLGSGFDGHSSSLVESQTTPLSGDTDCYGVPDWWESFHYRSLILADAHTDIDQDGRGRYQEYFGDTDPNNAFSRFEILSLSYGDSVKVTFSSSSPNRHYRLQSPTNLKVANWTTVNDSPVIGNCCAPEITSPWNNNPKGVFRIKVSTD